MRRALVVAVVALSMMALGACGDEKENKDALGASACSAAATAGTATGVTLPQNFPQVSKVTFTSSTTAGPTTITNGSAEAKLGDLFKEYKAQLAKPPFNVTKSEKEEDDAEVNFESAEATGQVKLRTCDRNKTAIQVTARPK